MQKPTQRIKVFIDTNVLIAGVHSVTGASASILDLCEARVLQMVVSQQVLIEADRNLGFGRIRGRFLDSLTIADRYRLFLICFPSVYGHQSDKFSIIRKSGFDPGYTMKSHCR